MKQAIENYLTRFSDELYFKEALLRTVRKFCAWLVPTNVLKKNPAPSRLLGSCWERSWVGAIFHNLNSSPISTRTKLQLLVYGTIICIVILGIIAYSNVEFIEKHAPSANAVMHGGEIADKSDVEYAVLKMAEDISALVAPTKSKDWARMRSEFLSKKLYLNDLKARNDNFQRRTLMEAEHDAVEYDEDVCKRIGFEFAPVVRDYTRALDEEFSILRSAPTPTQTAVSSWISWGKREASARQRLSAYFADAEAQGCEK